MRGRQPSAEARVRLNRMGHLEDGLTRSVTAEGDVPAEPHAHELCRQPKRA